jgi:hypothetical protein
MSSRCSHPQGPCLETKSKEGIKKTFLKSNVKNVKKLIADGVGSREFQESPGDPKKAWAELSCAGTSNYCDVQVLQAKNGTFGPTDLMVRNPLSDQKCIVWYIDFGTCSEENRQNYNLLGGMVAGVFMKLAYYKAKSHIKKNGVGFTCTQAISVKIKKLFATECCAQTEEDVESQEGVNVDMNILGNLEKSISGHAITQNTIYDGQNDKSYVDL